MGTDLYTPTIRDSYESVQAFLDTEAAVSNTEGIVPPNFSAGLAILPPLERFDRFLSGAKLLFSYYDVLDYFIDSKNPVLNLGVGLEIVLLEILSVRGGFHDGLFAAGFGMDLSLLQISFAMYGTELSSEPGLRPTFNAMVGIEVRL